MKIYATKLFDREEKDYGVMYDFFETLSKLTWIEPFEVMVRHRRKKCWLSILERMPDELDPWYTEDDEEKF